MTFQPKLNSFVPSNDIALKGDQLQKGTVDFRTAASYKNQDVRGILGKLGAGMFSKEDKQVSKLQDTMKSTTQEIKQNSKQLTTINSYMKQQVTLTSEMLSTLQSMNTLLKNVANANSLDNPTSAASPTATGGLLSSLGAFAKRFLVPLGIAAGAAAVGVLGANMSRDNTGDVREPGYIPPTVGPGVDRAPGERGPGGTQYPQNGTRKPIEPSSEQFQSPIPPHMRHRMSAGISTPEGKAVDRSQFDEQMKDPTIRAAVAARAQIEVGNQPNAQRKWLESLFNRARDFHNGDLMAAVDNRKNSKGKGYYPNKDDARWEELRKQPPSAHWEKHMDDVHRRGTNDARGATGNESLDVQSHGAPITSSADGERFVMEHGSKPERMKFRDLTPEEKAEKEKNTRSDATRTNVDPNARDGVPANIIAKAREIAQYGPEALGQFMRQQGYPKNSAWCGDFAATAVKAAGGTPPRNPQIASNWRNWGEEVTTGTPQPGDVAVRRSIYSRNSRGDGRTGNPGSHVTLVDSFDPKKPSLFNSVGGNQGQMFKPMFRHQYQFFRARKPIEQQPNAVSNPAITNNQSQQSNITDNSTLSINDKNKPTVSNNEAIQNIVQPKPATPKPDAMPAPAPTVAPTTQELNNSAVQEKSAPVAAPVQQPQPIPPTNTGASVDKPSTPQPISNKEDKFFDGTNPKNEWAPNVMNYWKQGKEGIHV